MKTCHKRMANGSVRLTVLVAMIIVDLKKITNEKKALPVDLERLLEKGPHHLK